MKFYWSIKDVEKDMTKEEKNKLDNLKAKWLPIILGGTGLIVVIGKYFFN